MGPGPAVHCRRLPRNEQRLGLLLELRAPRVSFQSTLIATWCAPATRIVCGIDSCTATPH